MAQEAQAKSVEKLNQSVQPLMKEVQAKGEAVMENVRDLGEEASDRVKTFADSVVKEAKNVPNIIAKKVNEVIRPFAFDIFSDDTSSGTIPYLEGPKIALCVASINRTAKDPHLL